MKKQMISFLFSCIVALILPVLLCLFYGIGLNYHQAYLRAFGISYGLFKTDFNDAIYFGGLIAAPMILKIAEVIVVIIFILYFFKIIFPWIFSKLKLFRLVNFFEKKIENRLRIRASQEHENFLKHCLKVIIAVGVVCCFVNYFVLAIVGAEKDGEAFGNKSKQECLEEFARIDNKKNLSDNVFLLSIKVQKQSKNIIGFVLASSDKSLALYSKNKGLDIISYSDVVEMTRYEEK